MPEVLIRLDELRKLDPELAARVEKVLAPTPPYTTQGLVRAIQLLNEGSMDRKAWTEHDAFMALVAHVYGHHHTRPSILRWLKSQSEDAPAPRPRATARLHRRPITDPDALERRKQALAKARAARAEKIAAARDSSDEAVAEEEPVTADAVTASV